MLILAIVFFIIAAGLGVIILTAILQNKPTPKPIVFLHGPVAFIAILLVIFYLWVNGASALLVASLILFSLAALGGLTMFVLDMNGKPIPKNIAIVHPLVAVSGLIILAIYMLQQAA